MKVASSFGVLRVAIAMGACVLFSLPSWAAPHYSATLTVAGYTGSSTLTDFPVLVRISPERIPGFSYAACAEGGRDVAFALADGTALSADVDEWNYGGESLVWVRVPALSQGTAITMTWGDPDAVAQTRGSAWRDDYAFVFHMNEKGQAKPAIDATAHCRNATPFFGVKFPLDEGKRAKTLPTGRPETMHEKLYGPLGYSRQNRIGPFVGCNLLQVGGTEDLALGGTFTVSAWVHSYTVQPGPIVTRKQKAADADGWELSVCGETSQAGLTRVNARPASGTMYSGEGASLLADPFVHVVLVFNDRTVRIYSNGILVGEKSMDAAATDNGKTIGIGGFDEERGGWAGAYAGCYDEVRLLDAVVSSDWVTAEYDTVATEGFLVASPAQSRGETALLRVSSTLPSEGTYVSTVGDGSIAGGLGAVAVDLGAGGVTADLSAATGDAYMGARIAVVGYELVQGGTVTTNAGSSCQLTVTGPTSVRWLLRREYELMVREFEGGTLNVNGEEFTGSIGVQKFLPADTWNELVFTPDDNTKQAVFGGITNYSSGVAAFSRNRLQLSPTNAVELTITLRDASVFTSKSYIQKGLWAQYDGEEHGDDPTVWKDLVGNGGDIPVNVESPAWDGKALRFKGTSLIADNSEGRSFLLTPNPYWSADFQIDTFMMSEHLYDYENINPFVVHPYSEQGSIRWMCQYWGHMTIFVDQWDKINLRECDNWQHNGISWLRDGQYCGYSMGVEATRDAKGVPSTATGDMNESFFGYPYDNATATKRGSAAKQTYGTNKRLNGRLAVFKQSAFGGGIASYRIYNRTLTQAEVDYNHQIDLLRFTDYYAAGASTRLVVSGDYGNPTPAYGVNLTAVPGTAQTFTLEGLSDLGGGLKGVVISPNKVRAVYLGYEYATTNGVESGTGTSFTIDSLPVGDLSVEWKFEQQFCWDVTAGAGGTTYVDGVARETGQYWLPKREVVVSAVPDATHAFEVWTSPENLRVVQGPLAHSYQMSVTGGVTIASSFRPAVSPLLDVSAADYVQDGLFLILDGLENVAPGRHADDSAVATKRWYDHKNGYDFTASSTSGFTSDPKGYATVSNRYFQSTASVSGAAARPSGLIQPDYTMRDAIRKNRYTAEVAFTRTGGSEVSALLQLQTGSKGYQNRPDVPDFGVLNYNAGRPEYLPSYSTGPSVPLVTATKSAGEATTLQARQLDDEVAIFDAGRKIGEKGGYAPDPAATFLSSATLMKLNYNGSSDSGMDGTYHALRLYSRPLSEMELLHNAAIDDVRFHGSQQVKLLVDSATGEVGAVTPNWGRQDQTAGVTVAFAAGEKSDPGEPDALFIAGAAGERARVNGYLVETKDGVIARGEGGSFELEMNHFATRVTWDLTREVRLRALAPAGCGVQIGNSAAGEAVDLWAIAGTVATVTAVPKAGWRFLRWAGAKVADPTSATTTLAVEGPIEIYGVFVEENHAPTAAVWRQDAGSGSWYDFRNWASGNVPMAGDTVDFSNAADGLVVTLDAPTEKLASLALGTDGKDATICSAAWDAKIDVSGAVTVGANGTITCAGDCQLGEASNRVWIVATDVTVLQGGRISADDAGYVMRNGPGWDTTRPYGQAGQYAASHGGLAYGNSEAKWMYGSAEEPTDPGSGGGCWPGGGAVRIDATGTVTVEGVVSADATQASQGGGSGGSVLINCAKIAGAGSVRANAWIASAPSQTFVYGAAGGRVAIRYGADQGACSALFEARGTKVKYWDQWSASWYDINAGDGTVCFPDTRLFERSGFIKVSGGLVLVSCGDTVELPDGTRIVAQVSLPPGRSLHVNGDLSIQGSFSVDDSPSFAVEGDLTLGEDTPLSLPRCPSLTVGGDFAMGAGASLTLTPTAEPLPPRPETFGADGRLKQPYAWYTHRDERHFASLLAVGGAWTLGTNATVSFGTEYFASDAMETKGSVLATCGSLTMAEGSHLHSDGQGWSSWEGCGFEMDCMYFGAAHGGWGGSYWAGMEGYEDEGSMVADYGMLVAKYGSPYKPVTCGSGGCNMGIGGGAIFLEVDGAATIDGRISADASPESYDGSQAASGGSVFIKARSFAGQGQISANGGDLVPDVEYMNGCEPAAGGGGRIALWRVEGDIPASLSIRAAHGDDGAEWMAETYGFEPIAPAEDGTVFLWKLGVDDPPDIFLPASLYVQDGLVAQFDGIENTAAGFHATTDLVSWKNLVSGGLVEVGGATLAPDTYSVGENYMTFDGGTAYAYGTAIGNPAPTLDGYYRATGAAVGNSMDILQLPGRAGLGFDSRKDKTIEAWTASAESKGKKYWNYFLKSTTYDAVAPIADSYAAVCAIGTGNKITAYKGGLKQTYATAAQDSTGAGVWGSEYLLGNASVASDIFSARFYGRALTAEEIAWNAKVDRMRFGAQKANYEYRLVDGRETVVAKFDVEFPDGIEASALTMTADGKAFRTGDYVPLGSTVVIEATDQIGDKLFAGYLGLPAAAQLIGNRLTYVVEETVALTVRYHKPTKLTWVGTSASASVASNWKYDDGTAATDEPLRGDTIVLNSGSKAMTWDVNDVVLAKWEQTTGYSGTVTFKTGRADNANTRGVLSEDGLWRELVVTGDVTVARGTWKITAQPTIAATDAACTEGTGVYQLLVRTGGDFNMPLTGSYKATIDAAALGFAKNVATNVPCSIFEPRRVGPGGTSYAGGGAIRILVDGAFTHKGTIQANGSNTGKAGGGWGGSILIRTASLSGNGAINATGGNSAPATTTENAGEGGHVAIYLTEATAADAFTGTVSTRGGTCGSVYWQFANQTNHAGTVVFDNGTALATAGREYADEKGNTQTRYAIGEVVLPNAGVTGEDEAGVFEKCRLVVRNGARLVVTEDLVVRDLLVGAASDLILNGHNILVTERSARKASRDIWAKDAYVHRPDPSDATKLGEVIWSLRGFMLFVK